MRKKLAAIAIVATVGLAASAAFAAWNASGTGSGTATARSAVNLTTVDATISPDADGLYPGGSAPLQLKVKNPNPYSVSVTNVVADPGASPVITVDAAHLAAGCTAANVSFTPRGLLATPVTVAGNDGESIIPGAGVVSMIADAHNACQGAVFTVAVQASGASNVTP